MTIVNKMKKNTVGHRFTGYTQPTKITSPDENISKYFLSLEMPDEPGQFLKLAEIMTETQVGFEQVVQEKGDGESARVVLITHETSETKIVQIQEKIKEKTSYQLLSLMKVMGE